MAAEGLSRHKSTCTHENTQQARRRCRMAACLSRCSWHVIGSTVPPVPSLPSSSLNMHEFAPSPPHLKRTMSRCRNEGWNRHDEGSGGKTWPEWKSWEGGTEFVPTAVVAAESFTDAQKQSPVRHGAHHLAPMSLLPPSHIDTYHIESVPLSLVQRQCQNRVWCRPFGEHCLGPFVDHIFTQIESHRE
jgi:hypothetical protein